MKTFHDGWSRFWSVLGHDHGVAAIVGFFIAVFVFDTIGDIFYAAIKLFFKGE